MWGKVWNFLRTLVSPHTIPKKDLQTENFLLEILTRHDPPKITTVFVTHEIGNIVVGEDKRTECKSKRPPLFLFLCVFKEASWKNCQRISFPVTSYPNKKVRVRWSFWATSESIFLFNQIKKFNCLVVAMLSPRDPKPLLISRHSSAELVQKGEKISARICISCCLVEWRKWMTVLAKN